MESSTRDQAHHGRFPWLDAELCRYVEAELARPMPRGRGELAYRTPPAHLGRREVAGRTHVVFVAYYPYLHTIKKSIVLRESGRYHTTLVACCVREDVEAERWFDEVHEIEHTNDLFALLGDCNAAAVSVQSNLVAAVVLETVRGPRVVVDVNDSLLFHDPDPRSLPCRLEQAVLRAADAFTHKMPPHAVREIREAWAVDTPDALVHSLPYAAISVQGTPPPAPPFRLVYAGGVMPYRVAVERGHGNHVLDPLVRRTASGDLEVTVLANRNAREMHWEEHRRYVEMEGRHPHFRFRKGVPFHRLPERLARFHYGMLYDNVAEASYPLEAFRHNVSTKVFSYLEAGLPVLVHDHFETMAAWVREHGIGVVYSLDRMEEIPELLRDADDARLRENVRGYRERHDLRTALPALEAAYGTQPPTPLPHGRCHEVRRVETPVAGTDGDRVRPLERLAVARGLAGDETGARTALQSLFSVQAGGRGAGDEQDIARRTEHWVDGLRRERDTLAEIARGGRSVRRCLDLARARSAREAYAEAQEAVDEALDLAEGDRGALFQGAVIFLTYRCNYGCTHCWNRHYMKPAIRSGPELDADEVIRLVEGSRLLRGTTLCFTGGEVFVRPDAEEIFRAVAGMGLSFFFLTNGSYPDRLERLLEDDAVRHSLRVVCLSLDGDRETHDAIRGRGAFDRLAESVGVLQRHGIPCSLGTVIQEGNLDRLERTARTARDLGVHSHDYQLEMQGRRYLQLPDLGRVRRFLSSKSYMGVLAGSRCPGAGCLAGITKCNIRPSGMVEACATSSLMRPLLLGDLRELAMDFDRLWSSDAAQAVRRAVQRCPGCPSFCER